MEKIHEKLHMILVFVEQWERTLKLNNGVYSLRIQEDIDLLLLKRKCWLFRYVSITTAYIYETEKRNSHLIEVMPEVYLHWYRNCISHRLITGKF